MASFSTSAISEAGKAVALAVVVSVLAFYVPVASAPLMVLMPLPLGYLTLKRGVAVGLAASVCTGALGLAFTGPGNALLSLLLGGLVGVALGLLLRRGWKLTGTLLALSLAAGAALVVWSGVLWFLTGLSVDQIRQAADQSLAAAASAYQSMGMSAEVAASAEEQARALIDLLPYLLPSLVGVAGLLLASASLALGALIFSRMGVPLREELSFSRFRLHWSLAYGFIVGLALLLFAPTFGEGARLSQLVGYNLLVFFQALFFLQGLAVVHWLCGTRKMGTGTRVLAYVALGLSQMFLLLGTLLGLSDNWLDYRKRYAPPAPATARQANLEEQDVEEEES